MHKAYKVSQKALLALEEIYVNTAEMFGDDQAEAYHAGFHAMFDLLSQFPNMGQDASEYLGGLLKFRYQSHLIFYSTRRGIVFVEYIYHVSQDFRRHMFDD